MSEVAGKNEGITSDGREGRDVLEPCRTSWQILSKSRIGFRAGVGGWWRTDADEQERVRGDEVGEGVCRRTGETEARGEKEDVLSEGQ